MRILASMGFLTMVATSPFGPLNSASASELGGNWSTTCFVDGETSSKEILVFKGENMTRRRQSYADHYCGSPTLSFELVTQYRVPTDHKSMGELKSIDLTIVSVLVTAQDPLTANELNEWEFCGFKNWKANAPRDVAGKTCGSAPMLKRGDRVFDVYAINQGELYFGLMTAKANGSTPATRPTKVDQRKAFAKDSHH